MKLGICFSIFIFSLSSLLARTRTAYSSPVGDINYWCSTTPHPVQCDIFMGGRYRHAPPKCQTEFRTMAIQVAMDQAFRMASHAKKFRRHCRTKHKKTVWSDCTKLFNNTVFQLNQTLHGITTSNASCTNFDAQTWLSTALTNIQTCLQGSQQLNVTSFISQITSQNVSDLISNSLAINGGLLIGKQDTVGDFPGWLSSGDRKLLQSPRSMAASQAKYVVALDGSGNFKSVQLAINYAVSARGAGTGRVIIHVRSGIYSENVEVSANMNNIMLVGAGLRSTIITGSRSVADGYTTYSCATFGIDGTGFIARGITFQNTAGPAGGQAVALRSSSDLSVFYRCGVEGYQDTLFVMAQRQFFKACYIYGTIDFIFGNAAVVFQNCLIYVRKPMWGQQNMITAQGRVDPFQNTAISIHESSVRPASDLEPVASLYNTYLGRPWQQYSRTVFLKTYLDGFINPAGWSEWDNTDFALSTLYFGEYKNFGPGSSTSGRVNWGTYHAIKGKSVASQFTVSSLIAGQSWLPSTGVPFSAGL